MGTAGDVDEDAVDAYEEDALVSVCGSPDDGASVSTVLADRGQPSAVDLTLHSTTPVAIAYSLDLTVAGPQRACQQMHGGSKALVW